MTPLKAALQAPSTRWRWLRGRDFPSYPNPCPCSKRQHRFATISNATRCSLSAQVRFLLRCPPCGRMRHWRRSQKKASARPASGRLQKRALPCHSRTTTHCGTYSKEFCPKILRFIIFRIINIIITHIGSLGKIFIFQLILCMVIPWVR